MGMTVINGQSLVKSVLYEALVQDIMYEAQIRTHAHNRAHAGSEKKVLSTIRRDPK